jgi:hypothetical protein
VFAPQSHDTAHLPRDEQEVTSSDNAISLTLLVLVGILALIALRIWQAVRQRKTT